MNNELVAFFLSLPYTIELKEEEEGWFVSVAELPGCISQGDTEADAREMIKDAMRGWIEVSLEDKTTIPLPSKERLAGLIYTMRLQLQDQLQLIKQVESMVEETENRVIQSLNADSQFTNWEK